MKRTLATAMLLLALAPAAALLAEGVPACCTGGDEQLMAPMSCCQTTMCSDPTPARQTKAAGIPVPALESALAPVDIVPSYVSEHASFDEAASPPVRIRLALISTLLI